MATNYGRGRSNTPVLHAHETGSIYRQATLCGRNGDRVIEVGSQAEAAIVTCKGCLAKLTK